MKSFYTFYLFLTLLGARELAPIATINASGLVSDIVEERGFLYVATDNGVIDIIDLASQKIVRQIMVPPLVKMDEHIPARIHSIDRFENRTLFVTSASNAYRNVWVEENGIITKIIDAQKHKMPKSAFFDSEGKIVLGSFGSDILRYDESDSGMLYERHISESTMGGMVLDSERKRMLLSDESGTVRLIDINTSRIIQTFDSEHVDNIYRVAYANGTIVTAGQDRRIGVYGENRDPYHLKSDFLVYSVAISPSGKQALYSSGTEHHLQLFDPETGKRGDTLVGHQATPNKILFITEKAIISAGDEETLYFWLLP